ncbi:receptor-type tyrosine-protein phosphatase N2-like isoform X2 [Lethenteron reissneri]|uniref:receptor-type tyrosine-protein phosphatase N2-like isoform X2 n=1 Tax=Lethenteron reissneri TaxID=7753 RepID=UPI002AB7A85D|nr:receptor-type tyrosine-protein phosphatase N2-like isoform X2 [Lethenteron reissneri]
MQTCSPRDGPREVSGTPGARPRDVAPMPSPQQPPRPRGGVDAMEMVAHGGASRAGVDGGSPAPHSVLRAELLQQLLLLLLAERRQPQAEPPSAVKERSSVRGHHEKAPSGVSQLGRWGLLAGRTRALARDAPRRPLLWPHGRPPRPNGAAAAAAAVRGSDGASEWQEVAARASVAGDREGSVDGKQDAAVNQEAVNARAAEEGLEIVRSATRDRELPGALLTPLGRALPAAGAAWPLGASPATHAAAVRPEEGDRGVSFDAVEVERRRKASPDRQSAEFGYIVTDNRPLSLSSAVRLLEALAGAVNLPADSFTDVSVVGPAVAFRLRPNKWKLTVRDTVSTVEQQRRRLEDASRVKIVQAGVGEQSAPEGFSPHDHDEGGGRYVALVVLSVACVLGLLVASVAFYCSRGDGAGVAVGVWGGARAKRRSEYTSLDAEPGAHATADYQELCRQRVASRSCERTELLLRPQAAHTSRVSSVSSQHSDPGVTGVTTTAAAALSPSPRSSISSWSEEPASSSLDITTGHMILSYMEDHLHNRHRLEREWVALCAYQAEPNARSIAQRAPNAAKNRDSNVLPYDHARVVLKTEGNISGSDYINASPIMDHDPRNPAYIAAQSPLAETVADFWQMVWESSCVVIVMLSPLEEQGTEQCFRYWPEDGSRLYHIYEVNLVSEHVWCDDFLVRSLYLKNTQTGETRTLTQFHFLTWPEHGVPPSARSLLDLRRKVNKCYRGRSCPVVMHCSNGSGRTGTYILIDMVLNRMTKGTKEIDIAASLEHVRDQRPRMVETKEQFAFALTAVAEEVNAILRSLQK